MKPFSCGTSAAALILVLGSSPPIAHAREAGARGDRPDDTMAPDNGTAVIEWNATALRLLTPATFVSTRILAMTHLEIYDSVIAITLDYEPYAVTVQAQAWTSADAAVASAAHEVLVNQLPAQATDLDAAYAASLAAIPDGVPKTNGMLPEVLDDGVSERGRKPQPQPYPTVNGTLALTVPHSMRTVAPGAVSSIEIVNCSTGVVALATVMGTLPSSSAA